MLTLRGPDAEDREVTSDTGEKRDAIGEDGGHGGHLLTTRRAFLVTSAVAASGVALRATGLWPPERSGAAAGSGSGRPVALVYRGPAASPGIPEDTASFLRTCPQRFRVEFCGPRHGDLPVDAATLARATLYVQPGGGQDFTGSWSTVKGYAGPLRSFVHGGGRYLGICMGGYLAGSGPGFDLLPGNCADYTDTQGAEVQGADDAVITVRWPGAAGGPTRRIYYQDGPYFWLNRGARAHVLARYTNDRIAAMVVRFGRGTVGVIGPHPEADRSWYEEAGLRYPGSTDDLGHQLVDAIMS
jgi:glutamine amidotransferase-like uncharacterized protein